MRYRLTQPEDFVVARDFIPLAFRYSPAIRAELPRIWSELLQSEQLTSAVLEESDEQGKPRILGVGISTFVRDDFAQGLLDQPVPYVNARLHEMIVAGDSPILSRAEIAAANLNGGMTLLPLHFCTPSVDIRDPNVMRMVAAAQDLFRVVHAGYRVKHVVKEVVNINLCRIMQASGMNLAHDYAAQSPELGLDRLPEEERPYLLSVRHEEMPLGSPMSMMFITGPIRFHFSRAEQKLLLSALLRETDEEIARDLRVSTDTVRTQWKSILQRVTDADPRFFPQESEGRGEEGVRGRGKRRHLLRYLQMHMEELRPHAGGIRKPRRQ